MAIGEEVLYMIFLDLQNVYFPLEISRFQDILEVYDVGTRDLFLL